MKKFNLSIKVLEVESFQTTISKTKKGTIVGNYIDTSDCPSDHNCQTEWPNCGPRETDNCHSNDCWSDNDPSCQWFCYTQGMGCTIVWGCK